MRTSWNLLSNETKQDDSVELSRFFIENKMQMDNLKEILEKAKSAFGAKDYQTAFEIWKSLAEQRNAEAQFNLGRMYSYGRGVKLNHKKAIKWYLLSAEQGDALSLIHI